VKPIPYRCLLATTVASALGLASAAVEAAPVISRLTPPSTYFVTGGVSSLPMIARFAPGQRFDLQATVRPDANQTIGSVTFQVDGRALRTGVIQALQTTGLNAGLPANTAIASVRGYSLLQPGVHTLTATALQSDGTTATATGQFQVVPFNSADQRVRNVIIMLGDGMGASQRTAARIVLNGYTQGKAKRPLAMDTFPNTAMIMTASLDTIITDSAPGMQNYVTGNKSASGQEGVWPDDTADAFDNPRVEYLSEYLHRAKGTKLGIVTTADVFDATPAANAVHTSNRGAGTGIVDQYLDDAGTTGLTVLLGGGRKWFLPNASNLTTNAGATFNGSARTTGSDYVLPLEIQRGWGAAAGASDPARDLIGDFQKAGWSYTGSKSDLDNAFAGGTPQKLLGLYALSNMNVAYDKINGRRGDASVVNDYGFPDQPMLDEMTTRALQVLDANSPNGFVLMVEGASIDKQAHQMDSTRWIDDTIEFDRAIAVAKSYATSHPDTLVIVTADHECSGAVIIGASTQTDAGLTAAINANGATLNALNQPQLRNAVVGNYAAAKFPQYAIAADGFPVTMDPDYKLLIGYGANGDRYESFKARPQPTNDNQQPADGVAPLSGYPRNNYADGNSLTGRPLQLADGFFITGQVPGDQAVHTGGDIPLSAYGRGASLFGGTIDNTDVFFSFVQAALGGTR
jgi:alkaline phosphatase